VDKVTLGTGLVHFHQHAIRVWRQNTLARPGDIVWFAPGEKHWHGATPTTAMSHIAIAESIDGKAVEWMEEVSEADYQAGPEEKRHSSERSGTQKP
jgi:hypothetical protein